MMSRIFIALLSLQLIFPCRIFASDGPMVVYPVHDGVSDAMSDEMAGLFGQALVSYGIEVISNDKVEAVTDYYISDTAGLFERDDDALDAVSRAKEHFYNMDHEEALAQIKKAILILETKKGADLRDAYIVAGIIERSIRVHKASSDEYLRKALLIDPDYRLDAKAFSPSLVTAFERIKEELSSGPSGSVSVESDPKVAEVYVNGVVKGVTPLSLRLPAGEYELTVATNRYEPVRKKITVMPGEVLKVRERLVWKEEGDKGSLAFLKGPKMEIAEGVRVSEILRVRKVAMINADEKAGGSGKVSIRLVDGTYKAGYSPIEIVFDSSKKGFAVSLSEASLVLAKQYRTDMLEDPVRFADPVGTGEPILLGKQRKRLAKTPAFWAILGGVVAAGAGGAIAAAMAGGGGGGAGAGTGSLSIEFK